MLCEEINRTGLASDESWRVNRGSLKHKFFEQSKFTPRSLYGSIELHTGGHLAASMSSPANSAFIFLGWKCAQAGRGVSLRASRSLTCSATRHAEAIDSHGPSQTDSSSLDPGLVSVKIEASKPRSRRRVSLTGSRRTRTLARLHPDSLPFEQLPYQCFQEARKILAADREEKLKQITEMRGKISRAQEKPAELLGGDYAKKSKLGGMQKHLEELKILADINDPLVKKRFEDEEGWSLMSPGHLSHRLLHQSLSMIED